MTDENRTFVRFWLTIAVAGPVFAAGVGWTSVAAEMAVSRPEAVPGVLITVEPAGTGSWRRMLESEARAARAVEPSASPEPVPFMEGPAARAIGEVRGAPVPDRSAPRPRAAVSGSNRAPVAPSALAPSISTGFPALLDNGARIPPDTNGAAGPSHLMTMLNSQVRVQNKTGGEISTVSLSTFWTSGTGLSGSPFDPKLLYDSSSGRWMATADANQRIATSKVFFAISATSDPTGSWTFFSFTADDAGTNWSDFPGFGVNSSWIAITNNMFTVASSSFAGAKMWVLDKASALAGGPLTVNVFSAGFDTAGGVDGFALKPVQTFDAAEPKLYIVDNSGWTTEGGTALIRMSEISGSGAAPTWSVTSGSLYTDTGLFPVANAFNLDQIDAAQAGSASTCSGGSSNGSPCLTGGDCPSGACRRIATNDIRMSDPVVRNGKIWCTHSAGLPVAGTPDRTAVFWYQLDPALMASSGLPIVQSGVVDGGPGVHHFFPSIAANKYDDVGIGFSRSDAGRFVEATATGRLGGDPSGTTAPVSVLKAGEAAYFKTYGGSSNRWGDYSSTRVDPCNDLSFWTLQEYAATANEWGTYWGKLTSGEAGCAAGCVESPPDPADGTYAACAGTVSGAGCALTCDSGFISSGDAVCNDGGWSPQTCALASCPANASGAPACVCDSGSTGTLTWNGSSWSGACTPVCGDGSVGAGEQCDDGNLTGGDCCSPACRFESDGAPCDDGLFCTEADACYRGVCSAGTPLDCRDADPCTTDSCDPGSGCVNAGIPVEAAACLVPGKARIQIRDAAASRGNRLKWQWNKGDAFDQLVLGSPDADTAYALCVYDTTASLPTLAASIVVDPSARLWRSRAPRGWRYSDREGASFGVQWILINPGVAGKTRIKLSAGGIFLPLPGPVAGDAYFDQDPSVIVQLVTSDGQCWTSTFVPQSTPANTATSFKAWEP